jgi:glycosyltransferase involved in cell wall biosynthesis
MHLIFYQNILSIHQSAFIRNLADKYPVTLVVEESINEERISHGWVSPDFGKTEIITAPNNKEIGKLINLKEAIHIFSGIDTFPLPACIFKIAVKRKLPIAVILEPFRWTGMAGKLRFLKYFILRIRYGKEIGSVLAIGNRGRWCYEKVGFSKNKIFDWAYFTEDTGCRMQHELKNHLPSLLFIGSISKRKNIIPFVKEAKLIRSYYNDLKIIGTGDLTDRLLLEIKDEPQIKYIGSVSNSEISQYIEKSDALVLPSLFDGWGAVINEALMCGVPVFASERCGASVLLKGIRGCVFPLKKKKLHKQLIDFLQEMPYSEKSRRIIRNWAMENISGEVAANYFESIMKHVFFGEEKPVAPWIKN